MPWARDPTVQKVLESDSTHREGRGRRICGFKDAGALEDDLMFIEQSSDHDF